MASTARRPPDPTHLLTSIDTGDKPLAIVLAGHNGSGKSTLWYDKLADQLRIPLVNADRLTLSILPPALDQKQTLRPWACKSTGPRRTLAEAFPGWGSALHGIDYGSTHAFCLRDGVQAKASVLYDCRDTAFSQEQELLDVAST